MERKDRVLCHFKACRTVHGALGLGEGDLWRRQRWIGREGRRATCLRHGATIWREVGVASGVGRWRRDGGEVACQLFDEMTSHGIGVGGHGDGRGRRGYCL
jgi:hypothetical protein